MPESSESEVEQSHSPEAAAQMGELWSLVLDKAAYIFRERPNALLNRYTRLVTRSWRGQDIFGARDVGWIYISEKAKRWLEKHVPGNVSFEEAGTSAEYTTLGRGP